VSRFLGVPSRTGRRSAPPIGGDPPGASTRDPASRRTRRCAGRLPVSRGFVASHYWDRTSDLIGVNMARYRVGRTNLARCAGSGLGTRPSALAAEPSRTAFASRLLPTMRRRLPADCSRVRAKHCAKLGPQAVIPEGAGPVKAHGAECLTRFCRFPGSVRTNAGEGSGSRLDRRSTRASGRGLDADPERRRIVAPGSRCAVVGGRVLQRPMWTG
jgi:hypothetical protein